MFFCSISGEPPQDPVVSQKSGQVYERRLILKYITENGTDPITGDKLEEADLISIKASAYIQSFDFRPIRLNCNPLLALVHQRPEDHSTSSSYGFFNPCPASNLAERMGRGHARSFRAQTAEQLAEARAQCRSLHSGRSYTRCCASHART